MHDKSKREKLINELNKLKKREREARESGNYDIIGSLHYEIHKKHQELLMEKE